MVWRAIRKAIKSGAQQTAGRLTKAGRRKAVMYRHGDVLVAAVVSIPNDARQLHHLTLAEGELTGHSHRIAERDTAVLFQSTAGIFLRVTGEQATLIHQEHGPISLGRGEYRVWKQREYTPTEIRTIRD